MAEHAPPEAAELPEIERELARAGWRIRFAVPVLEARYVAARLAEARVQNRCALIVMIGGFIATWLTDLTASPEVIGLSALLRFSILAPLLVAFVALDWRGKLGRAYMPFFTLLVMSPSLAASVETPYLTNPAGLHNLQAVPLLLLCALLFRLGTVRAACISLGCTLAYTQALLRAPVVPHDTVWSIVMAEAGSGAIVTLFSARIDSRDRRIFLAGLAADIRRRIVAEQNLALARLTQVDSLTGIGNRRCFDSLLEAAWVEGAARQQPVALILFDIDHFKMFNDALGHQAGDSCLRVVAQGVAASLRGGADMLTRYGGEEFALILPATGIEAARVVGERLRQAVLACGIRHPSGGSVTVSLGGASLLPGTHEPGELIAAADACLYEAKRKGRNRIEVQALEVRAPRTAGRSGAAPVRLLGGV